MGTQEKMQQLKEIKYLLEAALDAIPDMAWVKDCTGKYILCNRAYEEYLGVDKEQIIGKTDDELFPSYRTLLRPLCENAIQGRFPSLRKAHMREQICSDGRQLEISELPAHREDGELIGIIGTGRDITEKRMMESSLRDSKAWHKKLFTHSQMALGIFSVERFAFIEVNTTFLRHTGYTRKELIERQDIDLWVDKSSRDAFIKSVVTKGKEEYYEFQFRKKNGSIGTGMAFGTLLELAGEPCILSESFDITHQKVLEETAKKYQHMMNTLTQHLPGFVYTFQTRPNGKEEYIFVSPGILDVCGIDAESVQSDPTALTRLIHNKDRPQVNHAFNSTPTGEMLRQEFRVQHPVTGIRWLETRAKVEEVHPDGTTVWHGLTLDVTERKQMEEALQKGEQEYRSLAENSPYNITRWDTNGNILYLNPVQENFFKKAADEIIGKHFDEITPPDSRFSNYFHRVIETREPLLSVTLEYPLQDGTSCSHETSLIPEFGTGGAVVSILGISHDISEQKRFETKLEEALDFSKAVIHTLPDILFEVDDQGNYLDLWPRKHDVTFNNKSFQLGKNICENLHSKSLDVIQKTIREVDRDGISFGNIFTVDTREGQRYYELSMTKNWSRKSYISLARDITEREHTREQLEKNEAILRQAQRIAKIGSWELTFPGMDLTWSDEIYRIFELDPRNTRINAYEDFLNTVHPEDRAILDHAYTKSLKNRTPYDIVHRLKMPDGRVKYVHEKGTTYYGGDGNPIRSLGTVQDITEQKLAEQKIETMAHHDALTGLPNRILSQSKTEQAILHAKRNNRKTALLFIDLDEFKAVNDSLGHSTGDILLQAIARRLCEELQVNHTLSRQGGDEFLLIVPEIDASEEIAKVASDLLRKFEAPFYIEHHALSVSASIGIAVYPDHGSTHETLLKNADIAMYRVKERGKCGFCFYSLEMEHHLIDQLRLKNDLIRAIDNGELLLHYQPQVSLNGMHICGAEALLRWNHPQSGMIPPMRFIPLAESSGLITQIGAWVIKEACKQAAAWHSKGLKISIAVNISALQFKKGNLKDLVCEALNNSGLDPKYLELELTESIMIHEKERVLEAVTKLKQLGIQLSIDDFGTGYSSLAYLKKFSVDKLKIDRSFIWDILNDQEDAVIVRAIISMAQSLGLKTIAEGVEDGEVLSVIEKYGCDEVQGYHFSKPMGAEHFEKYCQSFGTEMRS